MDIHKSILSILEYHSSFALITNNKAYRLRHPRIAFVSRRRHISYYIKKPEKKSAVAQTQQ